MNVLVTHAYSNENAGDGALLSVLLRDINLAFKEAKTTVLTAQKVKVGERFEGAKVYPSFMYHAFNRFKGRSAKLFYTLFTMATTIMWAYLFKYSGISFPLLKKLKKISKYYESADLIIGVGGGYLRGKPNFVSLIELALLLHSIKMALIFGRPIVLYSQSVGPFSNKLQQALSKRILKQVDLIILRENISLNLLKQMGIKNNIVRSVDGAFSFKSVKSIDLKSILQLPQNKQVFGITVRQWLNKDEQINYEKSMAALADNLIMKGFMVAFIPQVTSVYNNDDDRIVSRRVYKLMQQKNNAFVIEKKLNHHQIEQLYSKLDFLVGTRFHSVIFALKAYVPCIAIEYEYKTRGIMGDLGLQDWVIGIKDAGATKLIKSANRLVKSKGDYIKQLNKTIPAYVKQSQSTYKYLQQVKEKKKETKKSSNRILFQNSTYLILSSVVMAAFGFIFWAINARLFSPSQIGIATLLVSALNLISLLSLVGFDTVIVRFLWHSKRKDAKINTAMVLVAITAAILGVGFLLSLSLVAPKLLFMHKSFWLMSAFVIFCITATWNVLTDAVFLAYRKTIYTLAINTIFSLEKVFLPFVLFALGASGILTATGLASLTGFVLSIAVMITRLDYKPKLTIDKQILTEVRGYSTANYMVALSSLLPPTIIPFIIAAHLGTAKAAYFYIAFMIANLLYVIPLSASRSLFAEGSYSGKKLRAQLKHAIGFISLLMIPSILFIVAAAPYLLHIFGKSYAIDGVAFLRLMAISGVAISSVSVINTVFRVTKQLKPLLATNLTCAFMIIIGSFIALRLRAGLVGIGWAWLIGNAFTSLMGVFWAFAYNRAKSSQAGLAIESVPVSNEPK